MKDNKYTKIFEDALYEYVSGRIEDLVFAALKDNGYDCNSTADEVHDFISDTSKTLKSRDIEEITAKFLAGNCDRNILQKMFGKKRK